MTSTPSPPRSGASVPEVRLARLGHGDLREVAAVHLSAFPASTMTAFGAEAVRRYYAWLLDGPHDAALVGAFQGDRMVGFCAAGVFRGAMSGFLRANRRYLMGRIATRPWLAMNPLIRNRLEEAVRITLRFSRLAQRRAAAAAEAPAGPPTFGVLSIATSPHVRGAGAGRALMLEAEARAREQGFERMGLSVHPDNHRAVRFYEQLGWTRRPGPSGAWTGSMSKDLTG